MKKLLVCLLSILSACTGTAYMHKLPTGEVYTLQTNSFASDEKVDNITLHSNGTTKDFSVTGLDQAQAQSANNIIQMAIDTAIKAAILAASGGTALPVVKP